MRIDVFADKFAVNDGLRSFIECRVWLSLHRWMKRVPWVGVRLRGLPGPAPHSVRCQIDAWVRGAGPVTATITSDDPYVAVGLATSRLRRAVMRRVQGLVRTSRGGPESFTESSGPVALVIAPRRQPVGHGVRRWLKRRHATAEVRWLSLPRGEWTALASGSPEIDWFRKRLELSLEWWPRLIVVAAAAEARGGPAGRSRTRAELQLAAERVRAITNGPEVMPLLVDPALEREPARVPWGDQATGSPAEQDEPFATPWALPASLPGGESEADEPLRLKTDLFLDFDPVVSGSA
jgi:hypothetical protein